MHRRSTVVASLAALALAACSPDSVTTSLKAPSSSKFALNTNANGNYLVAMRGNGIPTGFAERVASLGGKITYVNGRAGFAAVTGLSSDAAVQIGGMSGVAEVQADESVSLDSPFTAAQADAATATEPSIDSQTDPTRAARYAFQWNMRVIGADKAWAKGYLGDAGVTAAILDTGIDYDDLDMNGLVDLKRSASFVDTYTLAPGETRSHMDDGTVSKTFFSTRNRIDDYNGHGTNVATQVSSKAVALAGVTSKTTLIGVKVLGSNGSGTFSQIISGILWAADNGADVANMSLGGGFAKAGNGRFVGLINKTFNYAKAQGMLIVVAAGNSGQDLQHNGNFNSDYCDAPHVVCVASVGLATPNGNPDTPSFFTNYGKSVVTVSAPGGNASFDAKGNILVQKWIWGNDIASWVWSLCARRTIGGWTIVDKDHPEKDTPRLTICYTANYLNGYIGTSQASPQVAGLAASLIAKYGKGQPQTIKHMIEQSAVPLAPEYGMLFGRGRISVSNAFGL